MFIFALIGGWLGWKLFTGIFDAVCSIIGGAPQPLPQPSDDEDSLDTSEYDERLAQLRAQLHNVQNRLDKLGTVKDEDTDNQPDPPPTTYMN